VSSGLLNIKTIQEARNEASGGTLTHGTLVVVTDGENQSGLEALPNVRERPISVMSMGISVNISDSVLTAIGKDGSFLAPSQLAWETTLTEMARRIRARSDTVYEIAYCSPATQGTHQIAAGLTDPALTATKVECSFKAGNFTGSSSQECITFVDTECTTASTGDTPPRCGGTFQACPYTCTNGDICIEQACAAPQ
jgi:hypothetical protein